MVNEVSYIFFHFFLGEIGEVIFFCFFGASYAAYDAQWAKIWIESRRSLQFAQFSCKNSSQSSCRSTCCTLATTNTYRSASFNRKPFTSASSISECLKCAELAKFAECASSNSRQTKLYVINT